MTEWPHVHSLDPTEAKCAGLERRVRVLTRWMVVLSICLALTAGLLTFGIVRSFDRGNARFCALVDQAEETSRRTGVVVDPLLRAAADAVDCPRPILVELGR